MPYPAKGCPCSVLRLSFFLHTVRPLVRTASRKRQPLLSDQFSKMPVFENFQSQIVIFETPLRRPPPESDCDWKLYIGDIFFLRCIFLLFLCRHVRNAGGIKKIVVIAQSRDRYSPKIVKTANQVWLMRYRKHPGRQNLSSLTCVIVVSDCDWA